MSKQNETANTVHEIARAVGAEFGLSMAEGTLDMCLNGTVTARIADEDTAELFERFVLRQFPNIAPSDLTLRPLSDGTFTPYL